MATEMLDQLRPRIRIRHHHRLMTELDDGDSELPHGIISHREL
jgi:hypothetical protein